MITVTITGNLTDDPRSFSTRDGQSGCELRVAVDLPRGASPTQRVVLAAASHVVVLCERSLAGLRDTIRLQSVVREQAPQARLWLVEAGATAERALISKADFEKGIGRPLDARLSYDPKSAGAAANCLRSRSLPNDPPPRSSYNCRRSSAPRSRGS